MLKSYGRRLQSLFSNYKYYASVCCIIKDENVYLEEWITYHLKIGFEHFYIYDNGSAVPVKQTLEEIGLSQYATVVLFEGKSMQIKAYNDCLNKFGRFSLWIAFIDLDEFIVPKSTNGNLPAFLKQFEKFAGLGINWLVFGSSGLKAKTNRPQLESFVFRSKESLSINKHIKSIVQPRYVRATSNPHCFKYQSGKYAVNENFNPIKDAFSDVSVNKIQINHYYCRTLEEYQEKIKRGRSDVDSIERLITHFHDHDVDSNFVKDTAILEIVAQLQSQS
ncbi:glycosyltransferase family 2 protein [Mucilaginibacter pallidiroseus]|uniref:Glycosyltransferase family 2 protein n=1 Tax=Mucilaginibacter pallidiroseus TaxID=2599295 RepID=A0A563UJE4_9SPHI|nr:glycosyltransferase family 92 protein [Mucilaginibacter pallidiroseus]TWR31433.1 glycosyltransferase family 2 protein [Mucilaginibacter pallidiroseus]